MPQVKESGGDGVSGGQGKSFREGGYLKAVGVLFA